MYITLTNAAEEHKGTKLAIDTKIIATVYQSKDMGKGISGIIENKTYIFCPPHGTWQVEESLDDIVQQLNDYEWNKR